VGRRGKQSPCPLSGRASLRQLRVAATLRLRQPPCGHGSHPEVRTHPGGVGWLALACETREVANEHRALLSIEMAVRERPLLENIRAIRFQQYRMPPYSTVIVRL